MVDLHAVPGSQNGQEPTVLRLMVLRNGPQAVMLMEKAISISLLMQLIFWHRGQFFSPHITMYLWHIEITSIYVSLCSTYYMTISENSCHF